MDAKRVIKNIIFLVVVPGSIAVAAVYGIDYFIKYRKKKKANGN
jgi:hypothetical protein